ncbi:hypothetical protein BN12_2620025 [Nostocoides japonicum T1-X7]|uniref:Uncharacterized protein n=1 Tax=Nostocoides japonicum T1-X7 TaxID=1194083 RepID=A0A077M222_9MICO|nr:hypothetical protein [Tetrasphaera japonica]CCH78210.1 hypothetical protein BN12_2620025 [Tetrasphaera japonica T1-X7]
MSYLGNRLELDERSSLTCIGIRPLAHEIVATSGTIYVHVVILPEGSSSTVASGAVAAFLPATLATISGDQTDGPSWFVTFQLAVDDRDAARDEHTADAALLRCLELTGLDTGDPVGQPLRAEELRAAYDAVGDVSDWTISDLLTGLLIELASIDLADVVADGSLPAPSAGDTAALRRERFHGLLSSWATDCQGPAV